LVGDVEDVEQLQEGDESKDAVGGGAEDGSHRSQLGGAMEVRNLAVGSGAHLFDEEEDNALKDEDDKKNDDDLRQLVLQKEDDVVMPIALDDLEDALILRDHGQKVHDYGVSLS
jgi:hypothetical protein